MTKNMLEFRRKIIESIGVAVEQRFIDAGGVKTAYLVAGQGRPVVLLHGSSPCGGLLWHKVIGPLAERYRVIVPDVVGYGETSKPVAPYDLAYYTAWLRTFLHEIGVRRAHVVGSSLGGAIAARFASDNPGRVARLVLVGAAGFGRLRRAPRLLLSAILYHALPSRPTALWYARHNIRFDSCQPDQTQIALGEYGMRVLRSPGGRRAFFTGGIKVFTPFIPEVLRRITAPTLLVWGDGDPFFPAEQARAAARLLPEARLRVIANSKHVPFLDQASTFNSEVLQFLTQARGRTGCGCAACRPSPAHAEALTQSAGAYSRRGGPVAPLPPAPSGAAADSSSLSQDSPAPCLTS